MNTKKKRAKIEALRPEPPVTEMQIYKDMVSMLPPEHMIYYLGLMFENYYLTCEGISDDVRYAAGRICIFNTI